MNVSFIGWDAQSNPAGLNVNAIKPTRAGLLTSLPLRPQRHRINAIARYEKRLSSTATKALAPKRTKTKPSTCTYNGAGSVLSIARRGLQPDLARCSAKLTYITPSRPTNQNPSPSCKERAIGRCRYEIQNRICAMNALTRNPETTTVAADRPDLRTTFSSTQMRPHAAIAATLWRRKTNLMLHPLERVRRRPKYTTGHRASRRILSTTRNPVEDAAESDGAAGGAHLQPSLAVWQEKQKRALLLLR